MLVTVGLLGAACAGSSDDTADPQPTTPTDSTESSTDDAPGEDEPDTSGEAAMTTSCFWSEPINRDQSNTQFPDSGATYWYTSFDVPPGAVVRLAGRYPHARYMSFNVYGIDPISQAPGTPFDGLADIDINPDDGSANPFLVGADRTSTDRDYEVRLVGDNVPENPLDRLPNTLYGTRAGEPTDDTRRQEVVYRVYVPDEERDLWGDTGLPTIELELPDGSIQTAEQACESMNTDTNLPLDSLPTLEEAAYADFRALGSEPTHPAHPEPRFRKFFNALHATLQTYYTGTAREPELASVDATFSGGYYSNLDNQYVLTVIDREFGPNPDRANIAIITGIAPQTPETLDGQETMESGDLRYWSLCQNESAVTTRVSDCLFDEQIPRDADGRYTVVVSRDEDRPANASSECGIAFMDWGAGDGVARPEYGLLILRHMLPTDGFAATVANVESPGDEEATLGEHLPTVTYDSREGFEERGCPDT